MLTKPRKTRIYPIATIISSILLFLTISVRNTMAADIPVEVYVEGGLTITLNGDWETGIIYEEIVLPMISDITRPWTGSEQQDYITYADDTTTAGFYITMDMTDFVYSGTSETQGNIAASNFTLFGEYDGSSATITKGYDDPTKNLSILPNSCAGATTDKFTFHGNFSSGAENYSLPGSTSPQTLIEATVDCLNIGHLRFDRTELLIPQASEFGNYNSTIRLTIIDGAP